MSELAPIGLGRLGRVNSATASNARAAYRSAQPHSGRASDEVQVSPQATFLNKLRDNPIREDLVADVREQIADGTYETPEKLDAAVSELAGEL